ncbi:subtype B tannase [Apilactobacillus xinyiensis]|uniref:subtype B tannase n=1 Tax=Apilactobacillus xinyiensis TaxID=2841032 RepID=UPI001C7D0C70|nr:subtype B tannase [Apilactobacillus xinyiensis]
MKITNILVIIASITIIALSIIIMRNKATKTTAAETLSNTKYTKSISYYRNGTSYNGKTYNLDFNNSKYKLKTIKVNGKSIKVREYTNIVYVSKPVDTKYQTMNIYIPDAYFNNQTINGYTKSTAPIFMPNNVGGYMSGTAGTIDNKQQKMANNSHQLPEGKNNLPKGFKPTGKLGQGMNKNGGASSNNAIQTALAKGFVVATPGVRGRDDTKNGKNVGSAPASIVDLKAAVRYLKYNNQRMPGNANKIIADGTSAGGALTALLATTGNNTDYYPYLKAIGAADSSDNIYATYSFASITNLDHADSAYEWAFNGVNKVNGAGMPGSNGTNTTLTAKQQKMSNELKQQFITYINNLKLKQGTQTLTLNNDGTGSFANLIKTELIQSANTAIKSGTKITTKEYPWLTIKNGRATNVDLSKYFTAIGRSKATTAFDSTNLSSAETQLFSTPTKKAQHFTTYGMQNNTASGATKADHQTVKMMNPMNYIGTANAKLAKHFWIRYGTEDSNTSVAVPTILAQKLKNAGVDVNYKLQWGTGHAGDYDMQAMFKWAEKITK